MKANDASKNLITITNQLGLNQLIKDITHINKKGKNTIIDLIFTNSEKVFSSKVGNVNMSDHLPIMVTRSHVPVVKEPVAFRGRTYKDYISDNFCMGLKNYNWDTFWNATDPAAAWEILENAIHYLLDFTCPIKDFTLNKRKNPGLMGTYLLL